MIRERQALYWFCVNCNTPREMTAHGACEVCESQAMMATFPGLPVSVSVHQEGEAEPVPHPGTFASRQAMRDFEASVAWG